MRCVFRAFTLKWVRPLILSFHLVIGQSCYSTEEVRKREPGKKKNRVRWFVRRPLHWHCDWFMCQVIINCWKCDFIGISSPSDTSLGCSGLLSDRLLITKDNPSVDLCKCMHDECLIQGTGAFHIHWPSMHNAASLLPFSSDWIQVKHLVILCSLSISIQSCSIVCRPKRFHSMNCLCCLLKLHLILSDSSSCFSNGRCYNSQLP